MMQILNRATENDSTISTENKINIRDFCIYLSKIPLKHPINIVCMCTDCPKSSLLDNAMSTKIAQQYISDERLIL